MLCVIFNRKVTIEILYLFKLILDYKYSEEVAKRQSLVEAMFVWENIKRKNRYLQIFEKSGNNYKSISGSQKCFSKSII